MWPCSAALSYFQQRYQSCVLLMGAADRTLSPNDAKPQFGSISRPQPSQPYVVFGLTNFSALEISPLPCAKFALVAPGEQVLRLQDVRKMSASELGGVLHRSLVWPPLYYDCRAGAGCTKDRRGQENLPVVSLYNLGRSIGQA